MFELQFSGSMTSSQRACLIYLRCTTSVSTSRAFYLDGAFLSTSAKRGDHRDHRRCVTSVIVDVIYNELVNRVLSPVDEHHLQVAAGRL